MPISGQVPAKFEKRETSGERFNVKPGVYYVKLLDVDEAEPQPGRPADWGNSWKWRFLVADQDGNVITASTTGSNGLPQPLPMIQFTSDRMGISPAGDKARGREWFEALLRRELTDNENLTKVAEEATGQVAQAFITHRQSKAGTPYCSIAQMIPADEEVLEKVRAKEAELAGGKPGKKPAMDEVPF